MPLFSERSIWTMLHGIALGGGALIALSAALFALLVLRTPEGTPVTAVRARWVGGMTVASAVLVWLTVIGGTYVVFPPYRATPPEAAVALSNYPRSFLLAQTETAWLHSFAMEIKEHVPWIAAMLATAAAFIATRYGGALFHASLHRRLVLTLLTVCLTLVAGASTLGMLVNKVAPLQ